MECLTAAVQPDTGDSAQSQVDNCRALPGPRCRYIHRETLFLPILFGDLNRRLGAWHHRPAAIEAEWPRRNQGAVYRSSTLAYFDRGVTLRHALDR